MQVPRWLLPRPARHAVSSVLARLEEGKIDSELRAVAAGSGPIVAGPWMGEVGFELLYWVPFLAWFAERFSVDPARLVAVSRGGTGSWYRFAGEYRDVLDYVTPEVFRAQHDARVEALGEQKQTRPTPFEVELVAKVTAGTEGGSGVLLHPSVMYRLLKRFWWGHLGTSWVHRHTRYSRHVPPPRRVVADLPESYVAAKFYFNDCFPETEHNRRFVMKTLRDLGARGPVVSLASGVALDDHGGCHVSVPGVIELSGAARPSLNLERQAAVVAHASTFVGTYGGFAYLAPFYGVGAVGYCGKPDGFARSHLVMAHSAFADLGAPEALRVVSTSAPAASMINYTGAHS